MLCECHSCCTLPRVAVHRPDALLLLRSCHDSVARIVLAGSAETQWSHKETFGALGRMLEMLWEVQKAEPKWDAALEWGEASRVDPLGALEAHTMTLLALTSSRLVAFCCQSLSCTCASSHPCYSCRALRCHNRRSTPASWPHLFVFFVARIGQADQRRYMDQRKSTPCDDRPKS